MKRVVYHEPITDEMFSYENVLKQMEADKEKLIEHWGQAKYDERLASIKEAICTKQAKGS